MESRRKSNNHVKSPSKGKTVNAIEDVSGKTPCHTVTIPVCADAIVHLPSTGIVVTPECANTVTTASADVVTPECADTVTTACADVVTPECADVVLTVASSSLRPPNPGEGVLASQPLEVPLLGNSVRTNVKHNSMRTNTGSRRAIPSPASP